MIRYMAESCSQGLTWPQAIMGSVIAVAFAFAFAFAAWALFKYGA